MTRGLSFPRSTDILSTAAKHGKHFFDTLVMLAEGLDQSKEVISLVKLEPTRGLEPRTYRLQGGCSAS